MELNESRIIRHRHELRDVHPSHRRHPISLYPIHRYTPSHYGKEEDKNSRLRTLFSPMDDFARLYPHRDVRLTPPRSSSHGVGTVRENSRMKRVCRGMCSMAVHKTADWDGLIVCSAAATSKGETFQVHAMSEKAQCALLVGTGSRTVGWVAKARRRASIWNMCTVRGGG
jgi:hypothetical protein